MQLTILGSKVYNEFGILLPQNTVQTVSDALGLSLISQGLAIGTVVSPIPPGANSAGQINVNIGIPMILPSNGTVTNNGAFTLATVVMADVAGPPGVYMYLPAGTAFAGAPAGWFWTVFQTTSSGTIYNNMYTGGIPQVPKVLVPIVGAGAAWVTPTAVDIEALRFTIPGGMLGPNGCIRETKMCYVNNNVNSKILKGFINDVNGLYFSVNVATANWQVLTQKIVRNRGVAHKQFAPFFGALDWSAVNGAGTSLSIDTNQPMTFVHTLQLSTATDFATISGITLEIIPGF